MSLNTPKIIKNFLNANEKTENNFITALLLDKTLLLKEKELLLFIFHLANRSDDLKIRSEHIGTFTLTDVEKLNIAFRAVSSKAFQKLHKKEIINWNKADHTFQINDTWIDEALTRSQNDRLEFFYKLLLKQS